MTEAEFNELYGHLGQKRKVMMVCNCGRKYLIYKEKAMENLKTHQGIYICRPCCALKEHKNNPRGESTREKQKLGRLGKKHSEEAKRKMSEQKKKFFQTPEGMKARLFLAEKAVKQHADTNMNKSKRKVLYFSAKNNNEIRVCNSSGEFIACEDFLEKDPNVIKYETQVRYTINNRVRSLDFLIYYIDGSIKIIEVKPFSRKDEPKNASQIEDSRAYAISMGYTFELWCEKELNIKSWKEARDRADEYCKKHHLVDFAAYRAEKRKQTMKRHYDKKIAQDKVIVYCTFCNKYHTQLRITYNKNIKNNNGRYICIKENGHLVGSKPKPKKENPYAAEGKKQCNYCKRILPFDCFSPDKTKSDGYVTICKEDRARIYKEKYQNRKK